MRICPSCRSVYAESARTCPKDGLALIDHSITFPLGGGTQTRSAVSDGGPLNLADDAAIEPGMMVGDYRVDRIIAHGGMGVIYSAVHPLISKRVAIKVLSRRFAQDAEQIARFVLEARAVNQVGHHNIVDIFAIGELNDGRKYLVMELLDGLELNLILLNVGRFRPGEILPIYEQLCDGLAAAHAKGFVHRDLKPENVTVLRRHPYPFIKILDFGIAKLRGSEQTAVGTVLGTPEYMAPEQCRAGPIDARVDVYSLGVMLYELVTGQKPFVHTDILRLLAMQTREPPRPPSSLAPISAPLERLILRAMAKDPNERHQTVTELIGELRQAIPETLSWTASLDRPQRVKTGDRTRTLPPAPRTDKTSEPPALDAARDTHRAPSANQGQHDASSTDEIAFDEEAHAATQIADQTALTPIVVPAGSLLGGFADVPTHTALARSSTPLASYGLFDGPYDGSKDMVEATVVERRPNDLNRPGTADRRADGAAGLAAEHTMESAHDSVGGECRPTERERRPTPTAIDFEPPEELRDPISALPASSVIVRMIRADGTEAPVGRHDNWALHAADTMLSESPATSETAKARSGDDGPSFFARRSNVREGRQPQHQQDGPTEEERDDTRATNPLPQLTGPSSSESTQMLDTDQINGLPESTNVAAQPSYVLDEKTYHIPRISRHRTNGLGGRAITYVLVIGMALAVGALLLLSYGR